MLLNLHVKNLAIIEEEEIEFSSGLNILTGETGAGKSIILGALGLAMGEKPSKGLIRDESKDALAEAIFSVNERQKALLREMDIDVSDDEVILQRKITPQRTTARINGESMPAGKLSQVANILIDIYGQHDQQTLLSKKNHIRLLDEYSGDLLHVKLNYLSDLYTKYKNLLNECEAASIDESERAREIDLLRHEISEIESAKIISGEDDELREEYKRLSKTEKILEAINEALLATGDDISEKIGHAIRSLNSVSDIDKDIEAISSALVDAETILSDARRNLLDYEENMEISPQRLSEVSDRIDLINSLKRRFSKSGDIEDIFITLEENKEKLKKLTDYDTYMENLRRDLEETKSKLNKVCQDATKIRKDCAKNLSEQINSALIDLNFGGSGLEICFKELLEPKRNGIDDVSFLISTNPGESKRPLNEIASGGELSRIMLAIKTIFADSGEIDTLVFDEIDTGIGGQTAARVADRLSSLSGDSQVICITHLPQIAARANSHFLIEKKVDNNTTVSQIRKLSEEERVLEVARMLAGDDITEAAIMNAKMLMK